MNRINAYYSRDTSTNAEVYEVNIENDLPENATHEQFKTNLCSILNILRNSVDSQLNIRTIECKPVIEAKVIPAQPIASYDKSYIEKPKKNLEKNNESEPSEKQIYRLKSIALAKNISSEELIKKYGFSNISDLTGKDCWSIINKEKD